MSTNVDTAHLLTDSECLEVALEQRYPLSIGQKALWILHQMAPESAAYNVTAAFTIHEEIHIATLQRALHAVSLRHEALRTRIILFNGEPSQVVDPFTSLAITEVPAHGLNDQQPPSNYATILVCCL